MVSDPINGSDPSVSQVFKLNPTAKQETIFLESGSFVGSDRGSSSYGMATVVPDVPLLGSDDAPTISSLVVG